MQLMLSLGAKFDKHESIFSDPWVAVPTPMFTIFMRMTSVTIMIFGKARAWGASIKHAWAATVLALVSVKSSQKFIFGYPPIVWWKC